MATIDYEAIYSNLDYLKALPELNPKERGGYCTLDCPECNSKGETYIYTGSRYINCNRRNKCGYSITLWDYLQQRDKLDNRGTLERLAEYSGYELPEITPETIEAIDRKKKRDTLNNRLLDYFKGGLLHKNGLSTLTYLKGRGYTADEIKGMEIGYNPGHSKVVSFLEKEGYDFKWQEDNTLSIMGDSDVLHWLNYRDDYKAVIPYRDRFGNIIGFYGRHIDTASDSDKDKYKPLGEATGMKATPFLIERIPYNERTAVIVEGFFDALVSQARGVNNVIALNGSSLTQTHIDDLKARKINQVILCLDSDPAGEKGTEGGLSLLKKHEIRAYVSKLPYGVKDPDKLISERGIEAFRGIIEKPMTAAAWTADRIISKHGEIANPINRDRVLADALVYANSITDQLECQDFLEKITTETNTPLEYLAGKQQSHADKVKAEQVKNEYAALLRGSEDLLKDGQIYNIEGYIKKGLDKIRATQSGDNIKPISFDDYLTKLKSKPEGLKTGWPTLDEKIRIPNEALTIIGGRTSHGKTTVMLNMLLNMLEAQAEGNKKSFFFFSYEETQTQLISKVITILSETIINDKLPGFNLSNIERYITEGKHGIDITTDKADKIDAAIAQFKEYTEHDRTLWIIDEPFEIGALVNTLSHIKEKYNVGAIFIDYIQKIKSDGNFKIRQLELQDISGRLLDCAKSLSLPIILGAQLGRSQSTGRGSQKNCGNVVRLDNLREAGDIEQDANLVLGVWNEAMETAQESGTMLKDNDPKIDIMVLKNRNGAVNEKANITFHRPILKIREY